MYPNQIILRAEFREDGEMGVEISTYSLGLKLWGT
jgi:hypothetical protein